MIRRRAPWTRRISQVPTFPRRDAQVDSPPAVASLFRSVDWSASPQRCRPGRRCMIRRRAPWTRRISQVRTFPRRDAQVVSPPAVASLSRAVDWSAPPHHCRPWTPLPARSLTIGRTPPPLLLLRAAGVLLRRRSRQLSCYITKYEEETGIQ